ncbi:hypothetical protein [Rhizobium leguminosarum]|uniref:hypothetical protein n=1 Tax=Rhizobium leguminosarum TaxID=384 RepID=UPI001C980131|nr:hypothetical protein [Rhizobium leguminosarum]MBY5401044.1 hypothetical protein [Rhizobium leguminosarum]
MNSQTGSDGFRLDNFRDGAAIEKSFLDALNLRQWTGLQCVGTTIGSLLLLPLASYDSADKVSGSEATLFGG